MINDTTPSATTLYSGNKIEDDFVNTSGDTMTGDLDMGSNKITSSYSPVNTNDLTNKGYVDSLVQGVEWHDPVINEINFVTSEPTTPTLGDRYINTATGTSNQTAQSVTANYIYEWNGSSWDETIPDEGYAVWNQTSDKMRLFNGTSWVDFGSVVSHDSLQDVSEDDHHNRQHDLDSALDHTGTLSWAKVDKTGSVLNDIGDVNVPTPTDGQVLTWVNASSEWQAVTPSSAGEANTASNVGTTGIGVFKQKSGVDLELHKLNGGSGIDVTLNGTTDAIDIDWNPSGHTLSDHDNVGATEEQALENISSKGVSFPATPVEGQLYYHTGDESWYRYSADALAWICIS